MKPKTMMLMVVAVGCGLAASYMTSRLLAERNNQPPPDEKVTILVAKQKISPWVPLKEPEKFFELKEVPKEVANDKCLKSFDQLKDQRLKTVLTEGKFVTTDDLLNKDQMGLSGQLLPGQRAIALKVNAETLVGGFIQPGARVDVVSTMRGGATDSNAQTILQDMLVLAVDTTSTRDAERPTIIGSTVTLAAKPEECQKLSLAQAMGELRLTLRAVEDHNAPRLRETKVADLSKPARDAGDPVDDEKTGGGTRVVATVPTVPGGLMAPTALKGPKPTAKPDPVKTGPVKPEPVKTEPVKPEPEKPAVVAKPKKHRLKIVNGEYTQTAVFVWDDAEGWKKGRLGQNPDDDDDPPPDRPRKAPSKASKKQPEAVPAPAPVAPDGPIG